VSRGCQQGMVAVGFVWAHGAYTAVRKGRRSSAL
jgi:hypothetical protein